MSYWKATLHSGTVMYDSPDGKFASGRGFQALQRVRTGLATAPIAIAMGGLIALSPGEARGQGALAVSQFTAETEGQTPVTGDSTVYWIKGCKDPAADFAFQWLPDRTMDRAQALTGGRAVRAIGQVGFSLPLGSDSDPLNASFATAEILDGNVYLPKRFPVFKEEKNGECHKVDAEDKKALSRTLVGIRLLSNVALDPNSPAAAEERAARTLTTPDGGLVNVQLSRFLLGWKQSGFTFLAQAVGGAALMQVSSAGTEGEGQPDDEGTGGSSYSGSVFAATRFSLEVPVVPNTEPTNVNDFSIVLAADPYIRTVPASLRAGLEDQSSIWGATITAMAMVKGNVGLGVVYRLADVELSGSRWSIDIVWVR